MNNKILVFIMVLIVCLVSVSAVSDLGVFKKDSTINLFQTCDSCSYVNLDSVVLPDSSRSV